MNPLEFHSAVAITAVCLFVVWTIKLFVQNLLDL